MTLSCALRSALLLVGLTATGLVALSPTAWAQHVYREYEHPGPRELTDEDIRRLSIEQGQRAREQQRHERWQDEEEDDEEEDDGEYRDERYSDGQSFKDDDVDDVSFFYEELEDDGRWFEHPRYGYVWSPHRVSSDWRPYSRGHWVMTDAYGWYWVSEEPFGWATYHYGRWFYEPRTGWVWVPGTRWGPAWVAWRSSHDYVGWAPLPPDAIWNSGRGTIVYHETLYASPSFSVSWSFVEPVYMTSPGLWRYCAPRDRVPHIVRRSQSHTRYAVNGKRIVNTGIPVGRVERAARKTVPRLQVAHVKNRSAGGVIAHDRKTLQVYQPDMSRRKVEARRKGRAVPWNHNAYSGAAPASSKAAKADGSKPASKTRGTPAAWRDIDRPVSHQQYRAEPRHKDRAQPLTAPAKKRPANIAPAAPQPGELQQGSTTRQTDRQRRPADPAQKRASDPRGQHSATRSGNRPAEPRTAKRPPQSMTTPGTYGVPPKAPGNAQNSPKRTLPSPPNRVGATDWKPALKSQPAPAVRQPHGNAGPAGAPKGGGDRQRGYDQGRDKGHHQGGARAPVLLNPSRI